MTTTRYTWTNPEETQQLIFEIKGSFCPGGKATSTDPGWAAHFEDVSFRLVEVDDIDLDGDEVFPSFRKQLSEATIADHEKQMDDRYSADYTVREEVQRELYEALEAGSF